MNQHIHFKQRFTVAACTSLLAGLVLTLAQWIHVVPIIHEAEIYEQADVAVHSHGHNQIQSEAHHHDSSLNTSEPWHPKDGLQRHFFTASANVVIALGFALLLGAATTLSARHLTWRSGLIWGLAGYACFFIAPTLGLPPEVPGTEAAALVDRQLWWLGTVLITAAGLALLSFNKQPALKAVGVALLLVPHLIGAPQPATHSSTAPEELAQAFIMATVMANAAFWLALGGFYGFFHQKFNTATTQV